jgi:hypothetical protein
MIAVATSSARSMSVSSKARPYDSPSRDKRSAGGAVARVVAQPVIPNCRECPGLCDEAKRNPFATPSCKHDA